MIRYILIGGTGFFGSALTKELQRRGMEVITVARGRSGKSPDVALTLPEDWRELQRLIRPGDRVVYLLGVTPIFRPPGGRRT